MADDLVPTDSRRPAAAVIRHVRRRPGRGDRVVSTVRETSAGGRTHRSAPGPGPVGPAVPAAEPAGPVGGGVIDAEVTEALAARLGGGELSTVGPLVVLAGVDRDRYLTWLAEDRFGLASQRHLTVGPVGDGPTGPVDVVWWRPPSALEGPVDEWEPVAVQWRLEGPTGFGSVIVGHRYPTPSHRPDLPDREWPPVLDACRRILVGQGLAVHRFDGADVLWVEAAGSDDHWELWIRGDEDGGGAEAVSVLPEPVPAGAVDHLTALVDDLVAGVGPVEVRLAAGARPEVATTVPGAAGGPGVGVCDPAGIERMERMERMVALNLAVADELVSLVRQATDGT